MEFGLSTDFIADTPTALNYADVIVHVADKDSEKRLKAHKVVLAQSPYFHRIFQYVGNMPFVHVSFYTFHSSIVENAIKLLYGHKISILAKHSNKFCEFLKVLEVKYVKKDTKSDKNDTIRKSPADDNDGAQVEEKDSDEIAKEANERRRKAKSPENPPPTKVTKPTEETESESFDEDMDKWTATPHDRLDDIDFDVVLSAKKKTVYKCKHCNYKHNIFTKAEQHFIHKHQDPGNAPEVLKAATISHITGKQNFEMTKTQLQQDCDSFIAKYKLKSIVDDLRDHQKKVQNLDSKNLYPTLKSKKTSLITQLNAAIGVIENYLKGLK